MYTKCAELVAESIPGSLFQTVAYLKGIGDRSSWALFSLATSFMTIAFTSSLISFEFDINPKQRKISPKFYGYFPDGHVSRFATFLVMFLFTLFHCVGKIFSISLLYMTTGSVPCLVIPLADQLIYLLYRFVRGDLHYWMNLEGSFGWIVSFFARAIAKVLVDFTASIHYRHPLELGGLYWSFSQLGSHMLLGIASYLYVLDEGKQESEEIDVENENGEFHDDENADVRMESEMVTMIAVTCFVGWVVSFSGFLLSINRDYVWTFFDRRSGPQFNQDQFYQGGSDYEKAECVDNHSIYYASFKEDLRNFLCANWERWRREKPEWFTKTWRKSCPPDMVPSEVAEARGGSERRMSAAELLTRLSVRERDVSDSDSSDSEGEG